MTHPPHAVHPSVPSSEAQTVATELFAADLFAAFDVERDRILAEFFTFLRFPSVSSEPCFAEGTTECRNWLSRYLTQMGFAVELWPSAIHPILFAEWNGAGPDAPTVLIYHHYDVQPVDPLELWTSPPFEPVLRDGDVYARGAQDNKGQTWFTISALKCILDRCGALPVNVKLCIEGEEEIGSPGLAAAARERADRIRADHLLVLDCNIPAHDRPAVTLGIRGFVGLNIEVESAKFDLHSGLHGGLAGNANHILAKLIAGLHDSEGRVAVEGFYDAVVPVTPRDRERLSLHFDATQYANDFGASLLGVENGFTPNESRWLRPALDINGMSGGYTGDGSKTIIPARARASISARLVPDQDPNEIRRLIETHLRKHCPPGVTLSMHEVGGLGRAFRTPVDSHVVRAVATAYEEACDRPCEFVLEGWSVPVVADLAEISQASTALMGYGLATDAIHAPNEHFSVDRLRRGFVTMARTLFLLRSASDR